MLYDRYLVRKQPVHPKTLRAVYELCNIWRQAHFFKKKFHSCRNPLCKSKLFRWPDELLPKVMTVCGLWPINTARCERPMELFFLTKHLPTTYLSLQMSHNKQGIIADKDFANLCQISVLTWKTWHKFLFSLGLNNFDRFFFLSLSLDNIMLLNTLPLVRDGQARVTAENWAELPALSKSHCCFSFPQCIKKN